MKNINHTDMIKTVRAELGHGNGGGPPTFRHELSAAYADLYHAFRNLIERTGLSAEAWEDDEYITILPDKGPIGMTIRARTARVIEQFAGGGQ